jgi:hypothetical protein
LPPQNSKNSKSYLYPGLKTTSQHIRSSQDFSVFLNFWIAICENFNHVFPISVTDRHFSDSPTTQLIHSNSDAKDDAMMTSAAARNPPSNFEIPMPKMDMAQSLQ